MKKIFLFIMSISILFVTHGCGGLQKISLDLNCDNDCNNSNAIVVRVFQLRNADKFKTTSFESLIRNPEEILKGDLIPDSKFEKMLAPGDSLQVNNIEIKEGTKFLGIVGDFNSPAKDNWLKVISLDSGIDNLKIIVHKNSLTCKTDD
jgi:type VI secretion system VasD/TssJ family lipoprotein